MTEDSLGDKIISRTKEGIFCTEIITVTCPKCFKSTDQVITTLDRTFYGHYTSPSKVLQWCVIERHRDYIPDELIYVQLVEGNQENLNISSVPNIW